MARFACQVAHLRTGLRCGLRLGHAGMHSAPVESGRYSILWVDTAGVRRNEVGRWLRCAHAHVWMSWRTDEELRVFDHPERSCPSCGRAFLIAWPAAGGRGEDRG